MQALNDAPSEAQQLALREQSGWNEWAIVHPRWRTIMGSATALPHRAFGPAIYVPGSDVASRAQHFVDIDLAGFGIGFEGDWTVES